MVLILYAVAMVKLGEWGREGGGYCELFYYTTQRIQANSPILGLYLKPMTFLFILQAILVQNNKYITNPWPSVVGTTN